MRRSQRPTNNTAPRDDERPSTAARARATRRFPDLAFPFIILSLITLAVLPAVIQQETRVLRTEITDIADPARVWVTEVQFDLARQMAALRGFLITGEQQYLDTYAEYLAEEAVTRRELAPLAARLGPGVRRSYDDFRRAADAWHSRIQRAGIVQRRAVPPEFLRDIAFEQADFERALSAAADLEIAIIAAMDERRATIRAADTFQLRVTIALAILALLAAISVARISNRLRRLARKAEARRREVERVVEARARFVRGITHDLKNPLGAADGYAQLLEAGARGEITPGQRQWVERLRRSIHQALAIIDDVLLLSRAETGRLEAEIVPVDLPALTRDAVEDHRASARSADIDLRLEPLPPDLQSVPTDPRRVRQILGNLLSNAIKYTPAGGSVRVAVTTGPGPFQLGSVPTAAVAVRDTGPGIPLDAQEHIFEEFTRVDTGGTRGAGLGLAISQRLARLLGGVITVDSALGRGSTFTLWLPLRAAAAAKRAA